MSFSCSFYFTPLSRVALCDRFNSRLVVNKRVSEILTLNNSVADVKMIYLMRNICTVIIGNLELRV